MLAALLHTQPASLAELCGRVDRPQLRKRCLGHSQVHVAGATRSPVVDDDDVPIGREVGIALEPVHTELDSGRERGQGVFRSLA